MGYALQNYYFFGFNHHNKHNKGKKNKNNMHTNTFLRHIGIALCCLCLITACHNQPRQAATAGSGIRFTHEHRLPTTPGKDQEQI